MPRLRLMPATGWVYRAGIVEIDQHCRMTLGGQQQVGELPKHMRPDRLELVGPGHHGGIGVDAEVVRPEPHQALDEADVSRDGGIVVRLGFAEKVLAHRGFGLGGRRLRLNRWLHLLRRCIFGDNLLRSLLTLCLEASFSLPRSVELEGDTIGGAAAQQARVTHRTGVGLVELGDQRALGIGCDCGDRARVPPSPIPMQSQRCTPRVKCHVRPLLAGSLSYSSARHGAIFEV